MSRKSVHRKLLVNLLLVAAAGLLVAIAVLEPGKEAPEPLPPLTELDRQAVERVVIRQSGGGEIRLEKTATGWRITAPRDLPANAGKLDNLLAVTEAESQRRYPAAELDLESVGLAGDSHSLILNDATFTFGGTDPINGWRYVRVGDTVHLVRDTIIHLLRQEPLYWADNRILPGAAEVAAIELPERRVYRDEQGLWRVEPDEGDVGADALVSLVQRWESARALSVKPLEQSPGEDTPVIRVHLRGTDAPIEFRLLEDGQDIFLARPGLEIRYAITSSQRDDLTQVETEAPGEAGKPSDREEAPGGPGP